MIWEGSSVATTYIYAFIDLQFSPSLKASTCEKSICKKGVFVSSLFYESVQLWKRGEKFFEQVAAYIKVSMS